MNDRFSSGIDVFLEPPRLRPADLLTDLFPTCLTTHSIMAVWPSMSVMFPLEAESSKKGLRAARPPRPPRWPHAAEGAPPSPLRWRPTTLESSSRCSYLDRGCLPLPETWMEGETKVSYFVLLLVPLELDDILYVVRNK